MNDKQKRNKQQVKRRRTEQPAVNIIIGFAADKQQQLAMIVDVVKINALAGMLDPFMRYLRKRCADLGVKHRFFPPLTVQFLLYRKK